MQSVQKSRKICAGSAAAAASCCSLPATCTNVMGSVSGCLTDATHVFGYVRHTRKVGRDAAAASAAAAAAVGPARAAADAIARYLAQSSVVVAVETEAGAEDDVEVGQGNKSKIVIAVCAVCSTCVNVPYDPSTALRYDAIETDGVRRPMPVPRDTAIVCMTCFDKLPSSAAAKEVDNVLFVCPRCTNLASTALDVTKRYVCVCL
jgi:hypothetical protein